MRRVTRCGTSTNPGTADFRNTGRGEVVRRHFREVTWSVDAFIGFDLGCCRSAGWRVWLPQFLRDGLADEFERPALDRGRGGDQVEADCLLKRVGSFNALYRESLEAWFSKRLADGYSVSSTGISSSSSGTSEWT